MRGTGVICFTILRVNGLDGLVDHMHIGSIAAVQSQVAHYWAVDEWRHHRQPDGAQRDRSARHCRGCRQTMTAFAQGQHP
jgi:hypothetical protein